jgi:SAM-dependent methyltransferase
MVALEPGANLAKVLRKNVAAFPKVAVEVTTFEAWSGANGTFDLFISAQALHWVNPAVRYRKAAAALRPGGAFALIRNEQFDLPASLRAELDAAYARYLPAAVDQGARDVEARRRELEMQIERSARFGPVHSAVFPWTQRYTARQYLDLLSTHSDHAVLDQRSRKGLFDAVGAAIERHGGILEMPYASVVLLALRK